MKVLVTGGSGFIGEALMERLLSEGHEAVNYDIKPNPDFETKTGSILDETAFKEAAYGSDLVYHLAASSDTTVCRVKPQDAIDLNVGGTRVVADVCAELGVHLFYASTCCVYGDTPEHPSNETSICVPTDIYGLTKLAAEEVIRGYARRRDLSYTILRLGTTYGPGMRKTLAVYTFIEQALREQDLTIHGSGRQTRTMVYIDDLVEAMYRCMKPPYIYQAKNKTINLTGREELSVLEMTDRILRLTLRPRDMYIHVPDRPGQIKKEQIDVSMVRLLLDWESQTCFDRGLEETLKWVMQNLEEKRDHV